MTTVDRSLDHTIRRLFIDGWRDSGNSGTPPDDRIPDADQLARAAPAIFHATIQDVDLSMPPDVIRQVFEGQNAMWWKQAERHETTGEGFGPHPLLELVAGYIVRPLSESPANLRPDRIMPASMAMVSEKHPRSGQLIGVYKPAAHSNGQLVLPGFDFDSDIDGPALPLSLYRLGNKNPLGAGGRGAPLALRLWVEAILAAPLHTRSAGQSVAIKITLRELLERLYPGRRPRPTEYWPRLEHAVRTINDTWVPWYDPETGKGGKRLIVVVGNIPRGPDALDDEVEIAVNLPPGSGPGPVVSPRLHEWGARSAPAYFAVLNLAYSWWEPGMTRVPTKSKSPRHKPGWAQVHKDPERYPELSRERMVAITHPLTTKKNQREVVARSRETIKTLVGAGELRIEHRPVPYSLGKFRLFALPPKDRKDAQPD